VTIILILRWSHDDESWLHAVLQMPALSNPSPLDAPYRFRWSHSRHATAQLLAVSIFLLQSKYGHSQGKEVLRHHLEKLKNEDLVKVRRDSTFLWYTANTEALEELLGFLYAECCTRNKAIQPDKIVTLCK
jgi:DNA-binding transcriptional ArsR family regulator